MAEKEYIERGKINDYISKLREYVSASVGLSQAEYSFISDILTALENFPAADVEPVRHGHWVKEKPDVLIHWHCSVCKNCYYLEEPNANYCPNCGAKMDGGEEK